MQVTSITEQLFFTTVRIDTDTANGARGSGTGFIFAHKVGEQTYPFVVTNKHVVMGMSGVQLTFHQRQDDKLDLGKGYRVEIDDNSVWFGHPSDEIDIAILPFSPIQNHVKITSGVDLFFRNITTDLIPNKAQLDELDAIETVTFIGYPNGVWDSKNLLPIARRGTTASPIEVDFEQTPKFLIDASVFGGSSGSPVFIINQGAYMSKNGGMNIGGSRFHFVGVITAVYYRTHLNQILSVPIPTQVQPMSQQQEMIDLGVVLKARTVLETVEAFLHANGINGNQGAEPASNPS